MQFEKEAARLHPKYENNAHNSSWIPSMHPNKTQQSIFVNLSCIIISHRVS